METIRWDPHYGENSSRGISKAAKFTIFMRVLRKGLILEQQLEERESISFVDVRSR